MTHPFDPTFDPRFGAVCDCLEVRDGETADRQRPLVSDRVLIGSGSNCQIQIASAEVAMVHALLTRRAGGWHLEALAADPAVLVNGEPIRACDLRHGDLIGLAGVNLALVCGGRAASGDDGFDETDGREAASQAESAADEPAASFDVAAMTAEELVDALDRELSLLSELEGEAALEAELQAGAAALPPEPALPRDPQRVRGLAKLLQAAREFEAPHRPTIPMHPAAPSDRSIRPREAA